MDYQGKKFHYIGSHLEWKFDEDKKDFEKKEVRDFELSWGYRKYLAKKREKEKQEKIMALRHKLDYQMKTYGEVDELDYQEFIRAITA